MLPPVGARVRVRYRRDLGTATTDTTSRIMAPIVGTLLQPIEVGRCIVVQLAESQAHRFQTSRVRRIEDGTRTVLIQTEHTEYVVTLES